MSNNYKPTNWLTDIRPAALNNVEQGIRAATPELLWSGAVYNTAGTVEQRTMALSETLMHFVTFEIVYNYVGTGCRFCQRLRVPDSLPNDVVIGTGFSSSGANLTGGSWLGEYAIDAQGDTITLVQNKYITLIGGTSPFTTTLNLASFTTYEIWGLERVAG